MVRNDTTLSSVVKLQHLLSCLDDDAARRVKNLQIIGSNFAVAWEILTKRYDTNRVRLSAHMRRLLNMPSASHRSAEEITRLLDGVAEGMRAFSLLSRPVDQWRDWFLEIIAPRLDAEIREDWEKSLEGSEDFSHLEELVSFLENRARTLESSNLCATLTSKRQGNQKGNFKTSKSVSTLHSTVNRPNSGRQSQDSGLCFLCNSPTSWRTVQLLRSGVTIKSSPT